MEKTVRVCDGCGEELHEGFWYTCDVCGKEYCDICIGQPVFCPEHYQKVKEFIEGLKPKYKTWATSHYVVVEAPKGELVGVGMDSSNCGSSIAKAELTREAANALYEHIRRERGHS